MNEKKWKLNFFDVIIIVLVVVIGGVAYAFTHRGQAVETRPQRYQVELTECTVGLSEQIHIGDKLVDNVKNYNMGKVVAVQANPAKKKGIDRINGVVKESVVPDAEDIILTVEAEASETQSELRVDGNFVIKAGKEVAVKGRGYAGTGYIITVER